MSTPYVYGAMYLRQIHRQTQHDETIRSSLPVCRFLWPVHLAASEAD